MEQARVDSAQHQDVDEDDFDAMLDDCAAELQTNTNDKEKVQDGQDKNDQATPFSGNIIDGVADGGQVKME